MAIANEMFWVLIDILILVLILLGVQRFIFNASKQARKNKVNRILKSAFNDALPIINKHLKSLLDSMKSEENKENTSEEDEDEDEDLKCCDDPDVDDFLD